MTYRHTQTAYWPWSIALVGLVLLAVVYATSDALDGANLAVLAVIAIVVAVGFAFSRLTVTVDAEAVVVTFGAGWPRRRIPLDDIVASREVRNRWWHGWGYRMIPGGTMFNVWGLDAVELELTSGKVFRIGTDEPAALLAALPAAR